MKSIFLTMLCCIILKFLSAQIIPAISDSSMVACIFDPVSFDVQLNDVPISLPDSLNDSSIDKLLVKIFINKAARIDHFTVIRVLVGQDKKTIDYLGKLPEDKQTRRYYPFVRELLKKTLHIKKLSQPTERYTVMFLPIKIIYPSDQK